MIQSLYQQCIIKFIVFNLLNYRTLIVKVLSLCRIGWFTIQFQYRILKQQQKILYWAFSLMSIVNNINIAFFSNKRYQLVQENDEIQGQQASRRISLKTKKVIALSIILVIIVSLLAKEIANIIQLQNQSHNKTRQDTKIQPQQIKKQSNIGIQQQKDWQPIKEIKIPQQNHKQVVQSNLKQKQQIVKKGLIPNGGYPWKGKQRIRNNYQKQQKNLDARGIDSEIFRMAKQYLQLGLSQPSQQLTNREKNYYQRRYKLQQTFNNALKRVQFPFCVVIPSFKNAQNQRYLLPLLTVLRQDYKNYHIVYIDDASPDGTADLVQDFAKDNKLSSEKFKLIKNTINKGPLQNEYEAAINQCKQDEIFFLVDGDDGLIGTQVFKLFNHFYQTTDSWFIYGNYIMIGRQQVGLSNAVPMQILQKGTYRNATWLTSHPKSYYNMLFHKLNRTSLLDPKRKDQDNDAFFRMSTDRATAYQMVELSGTKVKYIPQIVYLYMEMTPNSLIRKHRGDQEQIIKTLQSFPKQKPLKYLFQQAQSLQARQFLKQKYSQKT